MTKDIINEYKKLLNKRNKIIMELQTLPFGYISKKIIKGNEYYYLQYRIGRKVNSQYIKSDDLPLIEKQLENREKFEAELPQIKNRLTEIEKATKLFDTSLYRNLQVLKISIGMDDISPEVKQSCIDFSNTMTAIEGIDSTRQAKTDLNDWKNGNLTFFDAYVKTLKRYGFKLEA